MEKDFAQNTFIAKMPQWIRWVLILPAAAVASILIPIIWALLQRIFMGESFLDFVYLYAQSFFMGVLFVYVGSIVAPKRQFVVSLILLLLITIFGVLMFMGNFVTNTASSFSMLIHALLIIIGGSVIVYKIHEGEDLL